MRVPKTFKFSFTKKELSAIPRDHLKLFLVSAAILNEINFCVRLVYFATNRKVHSDHEIEARDAQALYFLKILIGKIWECQEAIRKYLLQSPQCRDLARELDGKFKDALTALKQKFAKKSLYSDVRDLLAFHLDGDALLEGLEHFDDAEVLSAVVGPTNVNSLFMFSEELAAKQLGKLMTSIRGAPDTLDDIATDALQTAGQMGLIAEGLAIVILRKHCPRLFDQSKAVEVESVCMPDITEVALPFYVKLPGR